MLALDQGGDSALSRSPEPLEVFTYEGQKGLVIHALTTVKVEREFLKQVSSKLLPLYVLMEQALAKAAGRS